MQTHTCAGPFLYEHVISTRLRTHTWGARTFSQEIASNACCLAPRRVSRSTHSLGGLRWSGKALRQSRWPLQVDAPGSACREQRQYLLHTLMCATHLKIEHIHRETQCAGRHPYSHTKSFYPYPPLCPQMLRSLNAEHTHHLFYRHLLSLPLLFPCPHLLRGHRAKGPPTPDLGTPRVSPTVARILAVVHIPTQWC